MKKAVVLLSGGMDSAVTLFIAKKNGYKPHCLTFDYGQRHKKEILFAKNIARIAKSGCVVLKICLPWKKSALLDKDIKVPENRRFSPRQKAPPAWPERSRGVKAGMNGAGSGFAQANPAIKDTTAVLRQAQDGSKDSERSRTIKPWNFTGRDNIPATYVPARNTIFLSFGLSYAEAIGAKAVFIGVNAIDFSGYPDCRPGYYRKFNELFKKATKTRGIKIVAPLLYKTKEDIVRLGARLGVDFNLTWSCYKGGSRPCGVCDACRLREKGFNPLQ